MRISTADFFRSGVQGMLDKQSASLRTQEQLSSGKRFNSAAEDPSAAASVQQLRSRLSRLDANTNSVNNARTHLGTEEHHLNQATDILDRMREMAIAAGNPALNDANLENQALLVRDALDELVVTANARDADGNYLFSGYSTHTQPFVRDANGNVSYRGDQHQATADLGDGQSIAIGDNGYRVFSDILNGNGSFTIDANAANSGSGIVDPGEVIDTSAYNQQSYSLVMASATAVTGGNLSFTDQGANDTLGYQLHINGTLIDSLSPGDGRTTDQLAAAIEAQKANTGVGAKVHDGKLYLINENPGAGQIDLRESLTGFSDPGDSVSGFFNASINAQGNPFTDLAVPASADSWLALDNSGNPLAADSYRATADIEFGGIRTSIDGTAENGDRFNLAPSQRQDLFTSLNKLAVALETGTNGGRDRAALSNELNRSLADLERGLHSIDNMRSSVGSRLQRLDVRESTLSSTDQQIRQTVSNLEDLDFTEAASRLSQELLALQAAQQSFVRIQGLNLFDLLR